VKKQKRELHWSRSVPALLRNYTVVKPHIDNADESEAQKIGFQGLGAMEMSKAKILVVDDDPDVRLGLRVRLSANNYEVMVARDGAASIAEARKQTPDLITENPAWPLVSWLISAVWAHPTAGYAGM
jgi:PleD family two-component response regulator